MSLMSEEERKLFLDTFDLTPDDVRRMQASPRAPTPEDHAAVDMIRSRLHADVDRIMDLLPSGKKLVLLTAGFGAFMVDVLRFLPSSSERSGLMVLLAVTMKSITDEEEKERKEKANAKQGSGGSPAGT